MKSLRLNAQHDFKLVEEAPPEPSDGEVLIRITAVGICGSDLHWFEEGSIGDAVLQTPLVLGHEFAGVVASGSREGKRVAVDPAINCQRCRHCREGNPNLCERMRFAGHGEHDGALREFIVWPERLLHALPASLSDDDGAMLEPLGVALHASDLGKVAGGTTAAIFGCGPIGLLIAQVVLALGGRVVLATDPRQHRLEAAVNLGVESVVNPEAGDAQEQIRSVAEVHDIDVVFEAATSSEAVEDAIEAVRAGGTAVLCGIPSDDRTSFVASTARRKGLTIKLVRRMKHTYDRAIELATSGAVDLSGIISHRFQMADYGEAFQVAVHRSGLKVVIHPTEP